jgi:hypothetical protein
MKIKLAVFTKLAGPKNRHKPWRRFWSCRNETHGWEIVGVLELLNSKIWGAVMPDYGKGRKYEY